MLLLAEKDQTVTGQFSQDVIGCEDSKNNKLVAIHLLVKLVSFMSFMVQVILLLFVWFDRPGESSPEKDCCW